MAHVPGAWVSSHVARVGEDWMGVMASGIMLRQAMVGLVARLLMQRRRTGVLERASVVMGIIWMRSLALLGRMRLLWRIIDIVVRSYTIVARQRASDTWVPPERTALAGRRALNGKNLLELSPAGLRRGKLLCMARAEAVQYASRLPGELPSQYVGEAVRPGSGAGHM